MTDATPLNDIKTPWAEQIAEAIQYLNDIDIEDKEFRRILAATISQCLTMWSNSANGNIDDPDEPELALEMLTLAETLNTACTQRLHDAFDWISTAENDNFALAGLLGDVFNTSRQAAPAIKRAITAVREECTDKAKQARVAEILDIIASGNTDPDRMVELGQEGLRLLGRSQ